MDLSTILTGPFGALLGGVGAVVGKVIDLKSKRLDHEHALAMRDKDRELLAMEFEAKSEIAKVEADQQIALRDFDAAAASIAADRATYGDTLTGRFVDLVRGLARPIITTMAMLLVGWMTFEVLRAGDPLPQEDRTALLREALFISSVAVTWWFGARPSGARGRR